MELNKLFKKTLLCSAGVVALGASPAFAQIEEIVVTAQKREQSLQDVPVAVTAFTGDDMKQLGFTQPIDLAGQTPGLSIGNALGSSNPAITVRGVGINDFNTNTNPGVAVYVDEVYQPIPATLSFGLFDMARVEVLKGPQGTLYGRNATGGAVSFVTRRPTEELDGFLSVDVGNFGYTNIEAAVGGPITERISGRLSGFTTSQTEGHQTVLTVDGPAWTPGNASETGDHGKVDKGAIRGQLAMDVSDNFDLLLSYTYGRDTSDSLLPTLTDDALPLTQAYYYTYFGGPTCYNCVLMDDTSNPPAVDMESNSWNVTGNWDLGYATLTSVTGSMDVDHLIENDFAGTEVPVQTIAYGGNVKQISEELRLTSNEAETIDWIVGLYYSKTEQESYSAIDQTFGLGFLTYLYGFSALGEPVASATASTQEQVSMGIFVHTEAHVNDQLRLTGALRFSQDTLDFDAQVLDISNSSLSTQPVADLFNLFLGPDPLTGMRAGGVTAANSESDNKENAITWKIGVDYDVDDATMVYASASTGFKNQGFFGGLGPLSSQYVAYQPESILSFEAGFKSSPRDNLQVNGAVFSYTLDDPQVIVSEDIGLPTPNDVLWNVAEAKGYGAEMDVIWLPTDKLDIRFGISYLNSEMSDVSVTGKTLLFPLIKGAPSAYAPEWTYNGVIRYETPIRGEKYMFAQVDFDNRADAQSFAGRDNTDLESRTLVNARVGVTDPDDTWEIALWGRNLGDVEHSGYTYQILGAMEMHQAPRTFGVSFTYRLQ